VGTSGLLAGKNSFRKESLGERNYCCPEGAEEDSKGKEFCLWGGRFSKEPKSKKS